MSKKVMNSRFIAAVLLSSVLFPAVSVQAADIAPYSDRDSNALKVAYYFVYPIGKAAEFLIFRPLHTISALTQPDPDQLRAADSDDLSHCLSFRPNRRCGREQ